MNEYSEPIFDKDYCDYHDIRADWFKCDKTLAGYLLALVDEGTNENGEWRLYDDNLLSHTIYAILRYFVDGEIPSELEAAINKRNMKLSKLALEHAKKNVEEARSKVAENRFNGGKGGRPSWKNNT